MRGPENADERGAEGAEGCDLKGASLSPVGVGFGKGMCPSQRNCCKINVRFANFAAFCDNNLRLIKST